MCGITGILSSGGFDLSSQISLMTQTLVHRGPDGAGVWTDPDAGIALGHRRLSIVDLSPAGQQPMISPSGRYVLVLNGEIYNHLELKSDLHIAHPDVSWRGHSDTEILLTAIDTWGLEAALQAAVGMFALALWDRKDRCLYLARDRFGEKPLYYGWNQGVFIFGSELKALRAFRGFKPRIDRDSVALFLRHNYIPAPRSIWQGIHKLVPGAYLKVSLDQPETAPKNYWSFTDVILEGQRQPFLGTLDAASLTLERKLLQTLEGQMLADVPLGALLSGGVDSSAIVALMQAASRGKVRTYSIGFEDNRFDESAHAASVANYLGTDHTELTMTPADVLNAVPKMPSLYDEPFADSSQLPTSLVMAMAKQHVSVVLTGDAGDELFGGYDRYFITQRLWNIVKVLPRRARNQLSYFLRAVPVADWDRIQKLLSCICDRFPSGDKIHKLGDRLENVSSIDDLYLALLTEWGNTESLVLGGNVVPTTLTDIAAWPQVPESAKRMMAVDTISYMPDDILVKVDRAAMGVSLETRSPFLDHRVAEFAWRLPMHYKMSGGVGKRVLKKMLYRYVPQDLVERPKMGFAIPLDQWLRTSLREWAEDLLSEERLRSDGLLNVDIVRRTWEQHLSGKRSFGYRLWSVLMLQAWLSENDAAL